MGLFTNKTSQTLKACASYFKALNALQQVIFTSYIQRDYSKRLNFYENRIHQARVNILQAIKNIRLIAENEFNQKISQLENIYETGFSLNTLKLRIADNATFEVCAMELQHVSKSLSDVLQQLIDFLYIQRSRRKISLANITADQSRHVLDNMAKEIKKLTRAIERFEEIYRSTMQVVSAEPIVFSFFLQDLQALRDELEAFFLGFLNG